MTLRLVTMMLALLVGGSANAAQTPVRQPVSKWAVDYDAAQCVATRNYGTADDPIWLVLKAPPVGEVMQMAVLSKPHNAIPAQADAKISVDGGEPMTVSMLSYRPDKGRFRINMMNLTREAFQPVRKARSLSLKALRLNETLALSDMEPLTRTLDDCVSDLRKSWNVIDSSGVRSNLKSRAEFDLRKLFSSADYPRAAANAGDTGVVTMSILIDERGKVSDCSIIQSSGVAILDAQSCAVVQDRAKFKPAVDNQGRPAKDAYCGRIRWKLA